MTCILLNHKVPKHPTRNETPHYDIEAIKSFPATEKYEKTLIKIMKT